MNLIIASEKPYYVAVSEHGFGVDKIPAVAIRLAQTQVPAKSKPSQLLLYRSLDYIEPTDWKKSAPVWPNNSKPQLCGLTTTHTGFVQSPR
jgi:hypothetical protein